MSFLAHPPSSRMSLFLFVIYLTWYDIVKVVILT
jgi:hypothetical protein